VNSTSTVPFGNVEHLAADVDNAPAEFEALIEGPAPANFHKDHRDGFQAVVAEMEQVIFTEFGNPDVGPPQLGLHDVRIETTQARCEFPLRL
jgi:hypothetical protein